VPIVLPDPSRRVTVLFGSAVPVMVGVVSFEIYGAVVSPSTSDMRGAVGARESTATVV
jgi:hypothetical protein